jgi:hypothetical protein
LLPSLPAVLPQLVPGVHAQLRGLGVQVRVLELLTATAGPKHAPLRRLLLPLHGLRVEHDGVDEVRPGRRGVCP